MRKKQRAKRIKKGLGIEITPRDREMLTLIGLVRYMAANQLAREFFTSEDRCRRRLRKLFDAGYIKISILASNKPNIISLTASGRELVLQDRPELENSIQVPGLIKLAGVPHHLMLVETRLYLKNLAQSENGELLRWESGRGSLAEQTVMIDFHLVPDALAELKLGNEILRLVIEADCTTEGSHVLERKLRVYQKVMTQGGLDELWIVMQEGQERKETIERLVYQNHLEEWTRIMTLSYLRIRPVRTPEKRVANKVKNVKPYSAYSHCSNPHSFQEVSNIYPNCDRRADRIG